MARLALGPTQPSIQRPPLLFPEIKWPKLSVNLPPPSSNEVRVGEGTIPYLPLYTFMAWTGKTLVSWDINTTTILSLTRS
jgi:hypothetical protein